MRLGIYTGDFPTQNAAALFERIAALGFSAVQLNFAAVAESGFANEPHIEFPAARRTGRSNASARRARNTAWASPPSTAPSTARTATPPCAHRAFAGLTG